MNVKFFVRLGDRSDIEILQWCQGQGLISRRYACPSCSGEMSLVKRSIADGFEWRCSKEGHNIRRSVRKGTWFSNSHLKIADILLFTHFWVSECSAKYICENLSISSNTYSDWASFCREVCLKSNFSDITMLGGEGVIVEIDESKFGKRKYNRGREVKGKWVFGAIERESKKCSFRVVERRDQETLLPIIQQWIRPGTVIISDCWRTYSCLNDFGYRHLTVNHSKNFVDPDTGAHTNTIEGTWAAIKRKLSKRTGSDEFDTYLHEYVWRKHHKQDVMQAFLNAIKEVYNPCEGDN